MKNLIIIFLVVFSTNVFGNKQDRELISPFSEVSLRINATVYLEQGDSQCVNITAQSETIDRIITEVRDRKLIIRYSLSDKLSNQWSPGPISIHITVPEITALGISGDGDLIAEKSIQSRILDLSVSGSGNIKLAHIDCEKVTATMAGTGDLVFSGNTVSKELKVIVTGSGNIRAGQFQVEKANIKINGSGYANVNVTETLDVRIIGPGSVRYYGDPEVISAITGSGSVEKKETPKL